MAWLVIAALLAAPPPSARAATETPPNPHLAEARQAKLSLRYTDALAHLDRAEAWGKNTPAQLREIYQLGGELAGGLGMDDEAAAYFRKLLALVPHATLPPGTSPKIMSPFNSARVAMRERGALRASYDIAPGPAVVVTIAADPLAMVAGARVRMRVRDIESVAEGRGAGRIEIPVATGAAIDIALIDQYGNELVAYGQPYAIDTAAPTPTPTPTASPDDPRRDVAPSRGAWPYVAGASLALTATGIYFGLDARDAQAEFDDLRDTSDQHEAARALDLERRGDRSALIANVAFATAGVTAAVAVYLYVRRPRRRRPAIVAVPLRNGASVSATWSF